MRTLLSIGLGLAVLLAAGTAQAQLPVKSDFATVAPYGSNAEARVPAIMPYGLTFHGQHDFYPRMRYRGRHLAKSIHVYQPRRYYHPSAGYRYWYRF